MCPPNLVASTRGSNMSWSPPPKDYLKLNVDAHLLGNGSWGLCMILRGEDESNVGAATMIVMGFEDASLAEALGLREAMAMEDRFQLDRVLFKMDAKVIVVAI
ncbi:hypothetical protein A2U01_0002588 [Trifolium medium]|uniref:RNase H type-1 domain-containing protein n=1 Tax=Trifolium medium TaxID=97028 RepID=A0A392M3E3_9FABA|nr:hypothetical protein [Trifolium medium]